MLKKYKINNKPTSPWAMRTRILYFLLAWNAFGFAAYHWYSKTKKDDEEWQKMSMTQKYLGMMTEPDDKVKMVSFKGLDFKGRQQELYKAREVLQTEKEAKE